MKLGSSNLRVSLSPPHSTASTRQLPSRHDRRRLDGWGNVVGLVGVCWNAVLFLRYGLFLFAWRASSLVQDLSRQPRLLRGCCSARDHGLSLADLARGRLRLDRLSRNGVGETFFPWASPIPREARKSLRQRPPLRCGPSGASPIVLGLQVAIEAAMVAGSNSKGEVTWLTSVPSRSPATSTRARS